MPYTPGWDLVGIVDQIGEGVSGFEPGQTVAAMPISGCYAQYVCLPQRKFIPVPAGLDPAEAVAVVLNYITAYQMLHRSAKVKPGQLIGRTHFGQHLDAPLGHGGRAAQHTISFAPVTAKYFRVMFKRNPLFQFLHGLRVSSTPISFGPAPPTPTDYQMAEMVLQVSTVGNKGNCLGPA